MSVDELHEAIQQPLRATYPDKDKRFQSELVERLAKDAAEDAAYLPLLQVTLEEIWRKGTLTLSALKRQPGEFGLLTRRVVVLAKGQADL
jgi:hypothetical protein